MSTAPGLDRDPPSTAPALDRARIAARRWWARIAARPTLDWPLLLALVALGAIGLVALASASGGNTDLVVAQGARLGLGFTMMYVIARTPTPILRALTPWAFALSIALLLLVPLIGSGRHARSWIDVGPFFIQPAELLKLTLPLMLGAFLHARPLPPALLDLAGALLIAALPIVLIAIQPDFGTAALVLASSVFVIFLAGMRWREIGIIAALAAAAAPLVWRGLRDYQRERVLTFFDPASDPLGAGWNIIQAEIAIGSGGWFGKGFGASTQAKLEFLPYHTTDFIFAVIAEEFGLATVLAILALYAFIVWRGLVLAMAARDTWGRLVGGALVLTFFVYVMVNGGMVAGLLPVVGVPMPLLSYGGTSAVTLLAGFGVLMSIHAHRRATAA